jgi:membrane dipeptidase
MTLAHFASNGFADSMTDAAIHNGLSGRGRELIREMNRIGMIPDVSHISDKAVLDAVAESRAPVIASHSSVKAIAPIVRNMPDEVIRAIAGKGGVVCINFHAGYLDQAAYDVHIKNRPQRDQEIKDVLALHANDPRAGNSCAESRSATSPNAEGRLQIVAAAHRSRCQIAGPDHVALGSDFDGVSGMVPTGMETVADYPILVKGLIGMGYSDADIRKIMGLNLVRVLRTAEEVAAKP